MTEKSKNRIPVLRHILENPADIDARLAYADWLEEQGDVARAEFIRVQVKLTELFNGNTPRLSPEEFTAAGRKNHPREFSLFCREWELFRDSGPRWWNDLPGAYRATVERDVSIESADNWKYLIRNGFVESVVCTLNDWLTHGKDIVLGQPIREVRVTDRRPGYWSTEYYYRYGWFCAEDREYQTVTSDFAGEEYIAALLPISVFHKLPDMLLLTEVAHLNALSHALLSLAREQAGLPVLVTDTATAL